MNRIAMQTTHLKTLAIAILFAGSLFRSSSDAAPAVAPKPMTPAAPVLTAAEPRGVQLGETVRIKLTGSNLVHVSAVKAHMDGASASLLTEPAATSNAVWIELKTPPGTARGAVELSVASGSLQSGRLKIYTDDLPQQTAASGSSPVLVNSSVWGVLEKAGKVDEIPVLPQGSHTLVALLSAKSLGSKLLDPVLQVVDEKGAPVQVDSGAAEGGDTFVAFRPASRGPFRIQVRDGMLAGSKEHYYRLSVGSLPFVTGWFPLGVTKGQSASIGLSGYNLSQATVQSLTGSNGVAQFPPSVLQTRARTALKLESGDAPELTEKEPNDVVQKAQTLSIPGSVSGRFVRTKAGAPDPDCFRITAKAGERLMIETTASRLGSLADTRVEVLNPDGTPVPYLLLQAVRDSAVTFRGVDANGNDIRLVNWEEMDLDQFLYIQGDVSRIIRMPRGPDSGTLFYASSGRRESFFGTTATAHALDSPAYIVVPHAPGTKLVPNGLPVFPIHYVNDDSSDRETGTDSRLQFTAPADGNYVIRVSDARGFGGELYTYRLTVRPARPDFVVTLAGMNPTVNAGSGRSFVVKVDRKDGFEGPVTVETAGVPAGVEISSPVVVPERQRDADGTIFAHLSANKGTNSGQSVKVTAWAMIDGKRVEHTVGNFGEIKITDRPKLLISLLPEKGAADMSKIPEIFIEPGKIVPAHLSVDRQGDTNLVNLDIDSLPHGMIIESIGLNGVQIRAGEVDREIFLTAGKWLPEGDRLCHAVINSARATGGTPGLQTSRPVWIRVRKAPVVASQK